jgi:c-di-GMP-binding flagellar brake protein YcgR
MLQLGDFIYLHNLDDPSKKTQQYKCKVEEIKDNAISVTYPVDVKTNKTEFFVDGSRFFCHFTSQNQQAFEFQTFVLGRKRDKLPFLILSNPEKSQYKKVQRREFLRVEARIDTALHSTTKAFEPFTSISVDISAGGTAVILEENHPLKAGMEITVWLVLPMLSGDIVYLKQLCSVVRFLKGKQHQKERASLQFVDNDEKERQLLTKFCFEQQLSFRKKGLLN